VTDRNTKPKSPGDAADAAIDRMMMDRGANRTVPMVRADKLAALEAECARLQRMLDHATPWRVSDPPTDEEMRAIRLRWASGPEKYQADADALIAAVIHGRQRETELQAIIDGRITPPTEPEMVDHEAAGGLWRWVSTMNGAVIHGCSEDGARWIYVDPMASLPKRVGAVYETRYWALNAKRQLCAWPKVPNGT
jgi:hypothetical protein